MTTNSKARPPSRQEALRNGLQLTAEFLKQRRACDIPAGYSDDHLALDWLEWRGGTLRLTITGENICRHFISARPAARK
jgi:hypothetical protein